MAHTHPMLVIERRGDTTVITRKVRDECTCGGREDSRDAGGLSWIKTYSNAQMYEQASFEIKVQYQQSRTEVKRGNPKGEKLFLQASEVMKQAAAAFKAGKREEGIRLFTRGKDLAEKGFDTVHLSGDKAHDASELENARALLKKAQYRFSQYPTTSAKEEITKARAKVKQLEGGEEVARHSHDRHIYIHRGHHRDAPRGWKVYFDLTEKKSGKQLKGMYIGVGAASNQVEAYVIAERWAKQHGYKVDQFIKAERSDRSTGDADRGWFVKIYRGTSVSYSATLANEDEAESFAERRKKEAGVTKVVIVAPDGHEATWDAEKHSSGWAAALRKIKTQPDDSHEYIEEDWIKMFHVTPEEAKELCRKASS